jgi:ElaB/YqjD/DUF883 family membrane-anchored ribosome-binding protein
VNDKDVLAEIQRLVEEEHALLEKAGSDGADEAEQARLRAVEVALDQCWDFLRQRRARREFGENPNEAHIRDATTVERFQQ